jgi:hypothetical protein
MVIITCSLWFSRVQYIQSLYIVTHTRDNIINQVCFLFCVYKSHDYGVLYAKSLCSEALLTILWAADD